MTLYLIITAYALGGLATSLPAVAMMMKAGSYTSLGDLDKEDWAWVTIGAVLWPVLWLGALWLKAAKAYLRADAQRRLKGLGADYEKGTSSD